MSWRVVARKEFSDAVRSLVFWIVSGLFIAFGLLVVGSYVAFEDEMTTAGAQAGTALDAMLFVLTPVTLFAPLIALLVGYKAIVGEHESGSLRVLLSLPHTRWDVMFGKLLGRTAVVVIPVALAFVVMGALISIAIEPVSPVEYLVLLAVSIVFVAAFVAIAVAISGLTKRSTVAGAGVFGLYALFLVFWDVIELGLLYLFEGSINPGPNPPHWYHLVDMIAPNGAYMTAMQGLLPGTDIYAGMFPENPPLYLSEWAALTVLVAWLVIPFALGYWRFREADL